MIIKFGDRGRSVEAIQRVLGMKLKSYGYFGNLTKRAVKDFQKVHGLKQDGRVGEKTLGAMSGMNTTAYNLLKDAGLESWLSTDIRTSSGMIGSEGTPKYLNPKAPLIYFMDKKEYMSNTTVKKALCIHGTSGNGNPYAVIDDWNTDARGRVGTEYVIGGVVILKGEVKEKKYDGLVVRAIPEGKWAYHLGVGSTRMDSSTVGVEVCNYGPLTKGGFTRNRKWVAGDKDKYYNWAGGVIPEDQVCDLGFKFRGTEYYHLFTDTQIDNLAHLIKGILLKEKISATGLLSWLKKATSTKEVIEAFEFNPSIDSATVKGVISHTNVRKDKFDIAPQPKLVKMLKNIADTLV